MGNVIKLVKRKYKDDEPIQNLLSLIENDFVKVENLIKQQIISEVDRIPNLANYIIQLGGKRLRPILTLTCSKMCGYTGDKHINLAAAVELMHTATLLHDDVVDESNLRRGKTASHILWDNKTSILVGDFLLGKAFQLMVESRSLESLRNLSDASAKIAEGEVMQLISSENIKTTEDQYMEIIEAKTASLFSTSCVVGGLISNSKEEEIEALLSFGKNIGITFQLKDDALDYFGKKEELGKNPGDDFFEGKVTLPIILAYRRGNKDEKEFLKNTFEEKIRNKNALKKTTGIIRKYKTIEDTLERANHHGKIAKDALEIFPDDPFKDALMKLVDFSIVRSN
ncbi:MAG: polyprenyl synthetase family protein [Pseudomonadota bacterium]|nr:polyprenyl synthetase family protein [Pseudomonadota bacterium]